MEQTMRERLVAHAQEQLGCPVDAPFAKYPEYLVIRHPLNKKWAAAMLRVEACKVGGEGNEVVDVMNVKLDPLLVSSLKNESGYAPAWHMSKEHWLTVRLDGSVPFNQASALLEMSYTLVGPKRKPKA